MACWLKLRAGLGPVRSRKYFLQLYPDRLRSVWRTSLLHKQGGGKKVVPEFFLGGARWQHHYQTEPVIYLSALFYFSYKLEEAFMEGLFWKVWHLSPAADNRQ